MGIIRHFFQDFQDIIRELDGIVPYSLYIAFYIGLHGVVLCVLFSKSDTTPSIAAITAATAATATAATATAVTLPK